MSIESVKSLATEMVSDLRNNQMNRYADSLSAAVVMLDDPATKIKALEKIESACHVKAYGDLFLETLPGFEWPTKVSKLRSLCQKQLSGG
ncbi:M13 family metallopeptidase [Shewanella corallii]|uniref:M13 family metallopeptidase n=1 Tax=Shewanella corallii TaxID=560080 RepID=A0ABT0N812_9GAMM|nr:M13 family metallopeptidase [Shewanella corallii]MCL2914285.1 M13 family metallopeptidase [Shewanella corallii]